MLICLHRISTWESVSCHDSFQLFFFFRVKNIIFISSSLLISSSDCGCSCCVISTQPRLVRIWVWVWGKSQFSNLRFSHSQRASVVAFRETWFNFFHVFYSSWKFQLTFHSNNLHTHCNMHMTLDEFSAKFHLPTDPERDKNRREKNV